MFSIRALTALRQDGLYNAYNIVTTQESSNIEQLYPI